MSKYHTKQLTHLQDLGGSITDLVGAMQKQNVTWELGSAIADLYKSKEDDVRCCDKLETEVDDFEIKLELCNDERIKTTYSKILQRKKDQKIEVQHELHECKKQLAYYIKRRNRHLTHDSSSEMSSDMGSSLSSASGSSSK
jgi:hypothetical protein